MAASNAISAFGIIFEIDDGLAVFDTIGEVIDITSPNQQVEDIDVTHHASPGRTREYIAGLNEPGEMSVEINWIPGDASDVIVQALKSSGAKRDMRITWPNAVTWTFLGYVKGFEPGNPIDGKLSATVTVKVAGATAIA